MSSRAITKKMQKTMLGPPKRSTWMSLATLTSGNRHRPHWQYQFLVLFSEVPTIDPSLYDA